MKYSVSMESLVSLSDVELADEGGEGMMGGRAQLGGRYVEEYDGGAERERENEREGESRRIPRQVSVTALLREGGKEGGREGGRVGEKERGGGGKSNYA